MGTECSVVDQCNRSEIVFDHTGNIDYNNYQPEDNNCPPQEEENFQSAESTKLKQYFVMN